MKDYPAIALVGVHMEAELPFRYLLESGERVVGLVTLPPEQAAKVSGAVDFEPLAVRHRVPVQRVANVNSPDCEEWLKGLAPDLLLVVGWTQLLKDHILRIPKIAALGFHASLLPRYRGRAPVNWAIIHGETETGNTMIVLEPGADEGDIVAQRRIPIGEFDTCATVYEQVGGTEVDMLAEVLPILRGGGLPRRKQDHSQSTVMPKRRPGDGVIDWSKSAGQLHNWVRALTHPYPGAFTFLSGEPVARRLWVWRAEPAQLPASDAAGVVPGRILKDVAGWPVAAAGAGGLRLLVVQAEDGPETPGNECWDRIFVEGNVFVSENGKN